MEIGAGVGLVLGVVLGALLLARVIRRNRLVEGQLRQLSGAFATLLEERFAQWGLTRSERDVAWFTIKGLSIAEIARLRGTSEGTVKAHSNAIYRKAGVSGRTQLLSLFIEDLMEGDRVLVGGGAEGYGTGLGDVARPVSESTLRYEQAGNRGPGGPGLGIDEDDRRGQ
jgi:DNA-binding CsgD family transcriptional regulator